ncbi:MAG: metallophosphoesterase family protein [Bacteroidota bacterium]|nr:metallophosphoesterase family protein [Bacteroidota bacterium]
MKKILLLSDSHGYMGEEILKHIRSCDEVWHAGDIGDPTVTDAIKKLKPLRAVYGNIDGAEARSEFPLHQKFEIEGVKVWITHIGGYPNRYSKNVREAIKDECPDLFISGHSHILKVMQDRKLNLLHMNPGAIGKHGFHKVRTMLRFCIANGKIKQLEVIEFKR